MAGITLAQAEAALAEAMEARSRTLANESYSQRDRALKRARLDEINADIKYWQDMTQQLASRGSRRVRYVVPG